MGDRIVGLNLWRAMLMTAGLLVHGSIWLDTRPLFVWIAYVSSGTRMGVFFAIAGFLAARGLRGRSVRHWGERRMMQLLPPTAFGLAVVCPMVALLNAFHAGHADAYWREATKLHHLWFLVALCGYTVLAAAAWPALVRAGTPRLPGWALLPATALAGLLLGGLLHLALPLAGRDGPMWEERRMLLHLPVFAMGLALGRRDPSAWQGPRGAILPLATMLLVFGWRVVAEAWVDGHAGTLLLADLDDLARLAVSPPAAALLVIRSAAAIRWVPAWLDRAAAAALTLYLLHVPLILVANLATAGWAIDPHLRFVLAVTASGVAAYHIHHRIVARTSILAFLVNGTPLPRRIDAPAVVAA